MTLTFENLTQDHLHALREALELYCRCSMGQFGEVAKTQDHRLNGTLFDKEAEVDAAVKAILTPEITRGGYGIGSPKVGTQGKVCYELWKLLGGGTVGPPLNYSGLPLPKVTRKGE